MKNFKFEGRTLTLTVPSGGVVSGGLYIIGALACVAGVSAAENDKAAFDVEGVFELPKATGAGINLGVKAYWDAGASKVTATASGNTLIGHAVEGRASGDATVLVRLSN